jgi:dTDP-glucose 4,6-dehydratase
MHLIYGHRGWIAGKLTKLLDARGVGWVGGAARGDDRAAVAAELEAVRPARVVVALGRTHGVIDGREYPTIDYLEQPGKIVENVRDNYIAPKTVVEECARLGIHCTYLGTGCIFTYDDAAGADAAHPCPSDEWEVRDRERDGVDDDEVATFAGSGYSAVKGLLDRDLGGLLGGCLVLRLRMPISDGAEGRNFITKIAGYERICSVQNSMSDLPSLLPLMVAMIEAGEVGRYNFTNPGAISHNEVLALYRAICDPGFSWNNWTEAEQSLVLAAGRSNTTLKTDKLQDAANRLGVELPVIDVAIQRSLGEFARGVSGVRMLVTGGCGFIGSHFVNAVVGRGLADLVVNVDAMHPAADLERIGADVRRSFRYRFVKGDVGDLVLMKKLLAEWRITHVVHFAAQSHVTRSFEESLEYTRDNVVGTHTLLEAVRQLPEVAGSTTVKKFVHVSTDEVYGDSEVGEGASHFTEQSVLCPTNPYAATKAAAELIARAYRESFGVPVVVTRGNNVYGPGQHEEKLVPRFLALAKAGKKLTIEGDGSCVRAFMHVDDAVEAFLAVVDRGVVGEVYNIGCDEGAEVSVMEVARLVTELTSDGGDAGAWPEDCVEYVADRPYNDKRYYISNTKLRGLGWEPRKTDFAAGLAGMV